jgi:hypothetical protein
LFANHLYAGSEATHRDRYGLEMPGTEIRALGAAGIDEYNAWVVRESRRDPERIPGNDGAPGPGAGPGSVIALRSSWAWSYARGRR